MSSSLLLARIRLPFLRPSRRGGGLGLGNSLQGFDVLIRAGGEEEGDAVALRSGHMDGQAVTNRDGVVLACQLRVDGDQRHGADELAATAEFPGGSDPSVMGMRACEFGHRSADRRSGAVEMSTRRAATHVDSLQDLGLKGWAEAFGGCEAIGLGGLFEFCEGGEPELLVQLPDAVGFEAGDAQHVEHALRYLGALRFKDGVVPGLVECRDDPGECVPYAGDFREALILNELVERDGTEREVFCGAMIGSGTVRVSAFQCHAVADLTENLGDF